MTQSRKYRPFSNGTEFMDWKDNNCDDCARGHYDEDNGYRCATQAAIDFASCTDGMVTREHAEVIGTPTPDGFIRRFPRCAKFATQHDIDQSVIRAHREALEHAGQGGLGI